MVRRVIHQPVSRLWMSRRCCGIRVLSCDYRDQMRVGSEREGLASVLSCKPYFLERSRGFYVYKLGSRGGADPFSTQGPYEPARGPTRPAATCSIPNGSRTSLGYPIGATGAVITTKLMYELRRSGGRYGLTTMCIGGGQANAAIWERVLNEASYSALLCVWPARTSMLCALWAGLLRPQEESRLRSIAAGNFG
jgi:hypothetical protein